MKSVRETMIEAMVEKFTPEQLAEMVLEEYVVDTYSDIDSILEIFRLNLKENKTKPLPGFNYNSLYRKLK